MLKSILVGLLLTIFTVLIHAVGTTQWYRYLRQVEQRYSLGRSRGTELRILCLTVMVLLLLHIAEVGIWAMTYVVLPDVTEIETVEDGIYFSTVTFASLGYGDVVIAGPWRMLSAIQSMVGLLVFGWSTALLIIVVQHTWAADDRFRQNSTASGDPDH